MWGIDVWTRGRGRRTGLTWLGGRVLIGQEAASTRAKNIKTATSQTWEARRGGSCPRAPSRLPLLLCMRLEGASASVFASSYPQPPSFCVDAPCGCPLLASRPSLVACARYATAAAARCSPSQLAAVQHPSPDPQPQQGHRRHPTRCAPTTTTTAAILIRCALIPHNVTPLVRTRVRKKSVLLAKEVDKQPRGSHLSQQDDSHLTAAPTSPLLPSPSFLDHRYSDEHTVSNPPLLTCLTPQRLCYPA